MLLTRARVTAATATAHFARSLRPFHSAPVLLQGGDGEGGGEGRRGKQFVAEEEMRQGRPFLDPGAPRRVDAIRDDPMHAKYGGLVDILEHAAYCDGQREEHPEGFFFDNTRPEYDSDCDGDPFAASYLTEDEIEFPEHYSPSPYIPGRVMDAMWYLYTAKRWPIGRIADKYALSTARVSALLNLKATEGAMKASGRYDTRLDAQLEDLYAGRFGTSKDKSLPNAGGKGVVAAAEGVDGWDPSLDMGVKYQLLHDEEEPDVAMPLKTDGDGGRYRGHELRIGHRLETIKPPAKGTRVHDSKFVFRDVSGPRKRTPEGRRSNPFISSHWDGTVALATNTEALYRSWEPRRWALREVKGKTTTFPFKDEDANKPANFRLKP